MKDRHSLEADVLRTSECGDAASKRPPSRSPLDLSALAEDEPWLAAIELHRRRHPRRLDRIAAYDELFDSGEHRRIAAAVLEERHRPDPPVESHLNKADGRRKRIFRYAPADELLFRTLNPIVQPVALDAASPWCRSFLPGGGARAAFHDVLRDRDAGTKAALRLDIRDYFNSIDVDDLMRKLPESMTTGALGALLRAALLDPGVPNAGVMAGTPLAPLLATLYLRDLDEEIAGGGVTYARYSDDFVVLASPDELPEIDAHVRAGLRGRGLDINESKSHTSAPGEAWDFLGFRYDNGRIGLARNTERKFRAKSTRLARSLLRWRERTGADPARALEAFMRRTNRRIYGVPTEWADFSWATWFLPMFSSADDLPALDEHIRREARYAATGMRTPRMQARIPHERLRAAGHLPLVTAFWELREHGARAYDALVARRTGLAADLRVNGPRQVGESAVVET